MRIALIAPPFIEVPPRRYGGTELFIGNLASELHARGHDVTVYGNGDWQLPCRVSGGTRMPNGRSRIQCGRNSRTRITRRGRFRMPLRQLTCCT